MKISNSKKQLARIISENGGWREEAKFAWFGNLTNKCWFGRTAPRYDVKIKSLRAFRTDLIGEFPCGKIPNWHQTILSCDEYFHLYPAQDAELAAMCSDVTEENKHPEYCESVIRPIPAPSGEPTIEQLAAEYRALKDYADRKQQEADAAKKEAYAKLEELVWGKNA